MSERLKTAAPRATRETTAIFEYVSTPLNFRFYGHQLTNNDIFFKSNLFTIYYIMFHMHPLPGWPSG